MSSFFAVLKNAGGTFGVVSEEDCYFRCKFGSFSWSVLLEKE